jgi:hypothetical protein
MDLHLEPAAPDTPQECPAYALERELPARVVIIGDLNAQYNLLVRYLTGLKLMKRSGAWCGGRTVLVQMGDIPNRGGSSRAAMDLMMRLRLEALAAGGEIYWLLGNHEVMTAMGHEAYVSADEYLEFANHQEVDHFYLERTRFMYELLGPPDRAQFVEPMGGRVRAWEEAHAPGKAAFRAALGPQGRYGAYIRKLPVAFKLGTLLFVHGGLSPQWAALGLDGLEAESQRCWATSARFYQELDPNGLFRDPLGPLWHRAYCVANAKVVREDLQVTLRTMEARQMLVGHTRTDTLVGGRASVPVLRHRGRLVMTDVGLGEPGEAGSVLVVERGKIEVWAPGGERSVLTSVKKR